MITTAVVLARGLGTRMRKDGQKTLSAAQAAAAASGHKALMPIGEHRLIDYSLSAMVEAGITRTVLVVAPEHAEFAEHIADLAPQRLSIDLAVQDEPLGTANALASAEEAVGDAPFLMANGDNLYPEDAIRRLAQSEGNAVAGFDRESLIADSNIPAERIAAFAILEQDQQGHLTGILEKPTEQQLAAAGNDALVSMNLFAFTPEVFAACRSIEKSPRGEYEIVDAVQRLGDVAVVPVSGGVLDLSRRDDIEDVERRVAGRVVSL